MSQVEALEIILESGNLKAESREGKGSEKHSCWRENVCKDGDASVQWQGPYFPLPMPSMLRPAFPCNFILCEDEDLLNSMEGLSLIQRKALPQANICTFREGHLCTHHSFAINL